MALQGKLPQELSAQGEPKLFIFDLDGTLCKGVLRIGLEEPSREPAMIDYIKNLPMNCTIAISSNSLLPAELVSTWLIQKGVPESRVQIPNIITGTGSEDNKMKNIDLLIERNEFTKKRTSVVVIDDQESHVWRAIDSGTVGIHFSTKLLFANIQPELDRFLANSTELQASQKATFAAEIINQKAYDKNQESVQAKRATEAQDITEEQENFLKSKQAEAAEAAKAGKAAAPVKAGSLAIGRLGTIGERRKAAKAAQAAQTNSAPNTLSTTQISTEDHPKIAKLELSSPVTPQTSSTGSSESNLYNTSLPLGKLSISPMTTDNSPTPAEVKSPLLGSGPNTPSFN